MLLFGLFVYQVFALDSFLRLEDDCQCDEGLLGNGTCDNWCDTKLCYYDGGDCLPTVLCGSECEDYMLGDGICDDVCFTAHCYYDKGDCEDVYPSKNPDVNALLEDLCECDREIVGDGYCDPQCNNEVCWQDGGDCDFSDDTACSTECWDSMWDDGVCNPACDNENCLYDFGDCDVCRNGCRTDMIGDGIC